MNSNGVSLSEPPDAILYPLRRASRAVLLVEGSHEQSGRQPAGADLAPRVAELDVLDRYYQAALAREADVIVRITSDCPLIEPQIIDQAVNEFVSSYPDVDYASNGLMRTFPRGLDVEVMSFGALEKAWLEDNNPAWREHVTPYIQRNPDLFSIHGVINEVDYSHMRWTVDTPEYLAFVRRIYDHFGRRTTDLIIYCLVEK